MGRWISTVKNQKVEKGQCFLWRLGQSGFIVKTENAVIGMDLYLSDNPMRVSKSIVTPEELDFLDVLLGTHDHPDHIDTDAWNIIAGVSKKTVFAVPDPLKKKIRIPEKQVVGLKDMEETVIGSVKMTGVASAHEFLDRGEDGYPYMGAVFSVDGFSLYQPGDTCIYEGLYEKLRSFGTVDVMILPINGRDGHRLKNGIVGNMTYQEAVDLAGSLKPGLAIPAHYDMFRGNLEDPENFAYYMEVKYPKQSYWIGGIGDMTVIERK